jgi:hypothetical protein
VVRDIHYVFIIKMESFILFVCLLFCMGDLFIAVGSDDRVIPVVAESAEECAVRAVEEFVLDDGALDLSNWEKRHRDVVDDYRHWRWCVCEDNEDVWFDRVSIHSEHPSLGEIRDG